MQTVKLPFRGMRIENWQNIALSAFALFYLIQFLMDVLWKNMCGHLAIDYCAFWTAGFLANKYGYLAVYDVNLIEAVQKIIFPAANALDAVGFIIIPTPFLPIYVIPFQLLNFLGPYAGYWVWTLINLAVFVSYVVFFVQKTTKQVLPKRLLLMLLLSTPVFLNFLSGQINIWLAVFMGEFLRNLLSDKPFRAGLWLGLLMLKPQYLILIGIFLLLQRSVKVLAGLISSSVVTLAVSFALMGSTGFLKLAGLLLGYANGNTQTGVEVMMNWRMIGWDLSQVISPWGAWGIAFFGLVITVVLAIYLSFTPYKPKSVQYSLALLGVLAATCITTWHSHVPSTIILFPPLLYLYFSQNQLTKKPLEFWIFIPPFFHLVALFLGAALKSGAIPGSFTVARNLLSSTSEFGLNIYLLVWCTRQLIQSKRVLKTSFGPAE
jgi:hypothetical protein